MDAYLNRGGSVLVMLGEHHAETNINYILEKYHIAGNNDHVVRMVYRKKYPLPSQARPALVLLASFFFVRVRVAGC